MKNVMAKMKKRKGFTLVELIVVIAMIAILAGIAVPSYQGYRERAQISNDGALAAIAQNAILVAMADENITRTAKEAADKSTAVATAGNSWIAVANDTTTNNTVDVTFGPGISGRDGSTKPSAGEIAALESLINGGKDTHFAYGANAAAATNDAEASGGVLFFISADGKVAYEIDGRDYYSNNSEKRTVPK